MGPTVLFDKSFLQSLTLDEAVIFDHFFISVISPLFYVETLADLEKPPREGRKPEDEVRVISEKTPQVHAYPCINQTDLCLRNMTGSIIPMDGRVPIAGGRYVNVEGRGGVVFDEPPEAEAFRRWKAGEFREVERRFARQWRENLKSLDLLAVQAGMRAMGIDGKTCCTLADAKTMADAWVSRNDNPLDRLKLAMLTLGLPKEAEEYIAAEWKESGFKPLSEYAPVAAHVLSVEFFFQIALGASLINPGRRSNRIDVAYLSYAPFCMVFVSGDNLHRKVAPHFLRNDQSFVWGPDLKADLQRLVEKYKSLPDDTQELGLIEFAHLPPDEEQYLITGLYKKHFPPRPAPSFDAPDESVPKDYKPLPVDEKELLAYLRRFRDAEEVQPPENYDPSDPSMVSLGRTVQQRRGTFWQLPKKLKRKSGPNSETEEGAKMGFSEEHGKLLNRECLEAFKSVFEKVKTSHPDNDHAKVLMSNCGVALRYLTHINQVGIVGFSPIAVSLSRTYYEIVCSTMYLAENKSELDDFVKFGRLMHYEIAKSQRVKGGDLNILFPDRQELRAYFTDKKQQRGGQWLSWHGMTIEKLGETVGMEKYAEAQIVRSQYSLASKLVHGDSLTSLLLYDLDERGMKPELFAEPMEIFRFIPAGATCPLFIALLTAVDCGLKVGFKDEVDRLNAVWRKVMLEAVGLDVDAELKTMNIDRADKT
jgi:hypothetical protein